MPAELGLHHKTPVSLKATTVPFAAGLDPLLAQLIEKRVKAAADISDLRQVTAAGSYAAM